jgi:hypothetical protein
MTTELTEQQKICIKCQWCCRVKTIPLGCVNKSQMQLWLLQGLKVFFNHELRTWCALFEHACPHLDSEKGCTIYDQRDIKHEVCDSYMCFRPDGTYREYMEEACAAGREFLLKKFSEEKK